MVEFLSLHFLKEKKIIKNISRWLMDASWSEMLHGPEDFQAELRLGYFVFIVNALFLIAEM